jgi:hypothetical protein
MLLCACVCMHVCIHVCMHACVYMCVYMCVCMCVCMHVYMTGNSTLLICIDMLYVCMYGVCQCAYTTKSGEHDRDNGGYTCMHTRIYTSVCAYDGS